MDTLLLFSLIVIFECIALYHIKYSSTVSSFYFPLFIAILAYSAVAICLFFIIRNGSDISTVNITWNILSTIYGVVIGMIIFQERIHTFQWYGIILGTLSLILIFYKS